MPLTQIKTSNLDSSNSLFFRNRIINGAMMIDQRNVGASVTSTTSGSLSVDRWGVFHSQSSKFSMQQNAGSVTPPAGFKNYLGITSTSAYTPAAGEIFGLAQMIEGYNISDWGWGTANAKPITISFWVRSSLTGQFGMFFKNGGSIVSGTYNNLFYTTSYTINQANTWEYKTITLAGCTTGSWQTDNGPGIAIAWSLGAGTGGTPNTWSSSFYNQPTGSVNLVATSGATLYITGVQVEVGTAATPFEFRPYGTELALCQRYLPAWQFPTQYSNIAQTNPNSTTTGGVMVFANPVATRVPVTGLVVSAVGQFSVSDGDSGTACNNVTAGVSSTLTTGVNWSTATGRTAFRPHIFYNNTAGAYILGNGCEL